MNDLILNVDALEDGASPLEVDLPQDFLEGLLRADPPTEFHAAGKAHLRGDATKMGREVLLRGKFAVPLEGQCKRCLKPVRLDENVELVRTYAPHEALERAMGAGAKGKRPHGNRDEEGTEASFDPEAVDQEPFAGKEIDLKPALREQILLSIPPSPVCSEDCRGLCPKCGKDLNEGDCGCDRTVQDPRWAALKNIQLDKKEK